MDNTPRPPPEDVLVKNNLKNYTFGPTCHCFIITHCVCLCVRVYLCVCVCVRVCVPYVCVYLVCVTAAIITVDSRGYTRSNKQ